jgi:hypothetical protein
MVCTRALGVVGVVAALALSAPARAQGLSSNAEEPRAGEEIRGDTKVAVINEVERGFFLSVDYGANYYVFLDQPGFVAINEDFLKPGTRMGVRAGYDILNNVRLDVFVLANFNEGVIKEELRARQVTGDLAHFAPGAALRFDFVTSDDGRFFAYARAGAGYALWFPAELAADPGAAPPPGSIHTDVALGMEYYTKLRHLSVGLEVDFQALISPFAFGFQVYPTIKYTFGSPFDPESEKTAQ